MAILNLLVGIGAAPAAVVLAVTAGGVAIYVNVRKVDIEGATSASKIQQANSQQLLEQLTAAYDIIGKLREQKPQCMECPYK